MRRSRRPRAKRHTLDAPSLFTSVHTLRTATGATQPHQREKEEGRLKRHAAYGGTELTVGGAGMQRHYLGAMAAVAERLKDMPHVLGFDTLNEPSTGWIGVRMSDRRDHTTAEGPALPGVAWCDPPYTHTFVRTYRGFIRAR
jgi:hypothetical protein